ncbi:alcohol dehydrogenase [Catellatospora sp. TT07R-123]|uniref:zinc-binding dehydrogenase n=1 Tax=Catellatospora sp. TT07R-123 TaxID=2733863 RepID=UPI001B0C60B4|nr:zinc-binding dehydrogenase [Catellatospora sp. TT07R-123]GHJ47228.1 alcohol dehydrogenase [Catellatospora sp. TT07R-123]
MDARVRYARWDGVGRPFTVVTCPEVEPAPGEVLVEIELATVCGSDLHTVAGRRSAPTPTVLGHEQVGRVVAVGEPVGAQRCPVAPGDRVVWSVTVSCGACGRCARGMEQKCLRLRKFGHERIDDSWTLNGGFATHALLPAGTAVVPIPRGVPAGVAAPASCATATVAAVLDAVSAVADRRVLVTGAGLLGVTATAMAAQAGAEVVVCDPDPGRRALAKRFGAAYVVAPDALPAEVDIALELSGAAAAVQGCLGALAVGGHAVLAGSVLPGPTVAIDPERVVRGLLQVTGVHNYRPAHLVRAVEFLSDNHDRFPFAELTGTPFGLSAIAAAVAAADGSPALRQAVDPHR